VVVDVVVVVVEITSQRASRRPVYDYDYDYDYVGGDSAL